MCAWYPGRAIVLALLAILAVGTGCSAGGAPSSQPAGTDAAPADAGVVGAADAGSTPEGDGAKDGLAADAGRDATDATSPQTDAGPGTTAEAGGEADTGSPGSVGPIGLCAAPTGARASDVQAAYAKWKNDLVTSAGAGGYLRVRRPNSPGAIDTSNSEGTAYGMILAAAMDDEALFDALWHYEQLFLDGNGLMNWEINPQGTGPTSEGTGAATDADEDMAFALLWADHRWGGRGSLSDTYKNLALKQIDLVWRHEVDPTRQNALGPGDQFPNGAAVLNISYFAPAYYRLFGAASGRGADWNSVVDSSYSILAASLNAANGNAQNGLVPAWSTPAGMPQAPNASLPTNYQLDSCRTPFRIGQDYCFYGEPRAKDYLAKISAFYSGIGAGAIVNGYNLDGTPNPTNPTVHQSSAFVGPAGVGAMSDPRFSLLRDQAYAGVATLGELDGSLYYTESWTALSLVMMTGGYWNPTAD